MSKKTRIIILSVLAVLIVVVLSVSITTAFMKPIDQGGNITEVSLSSCAKIKLEGSTSINLSNSYPMSRNKGLETTPYRFTVTNYCNVFEGFDLYIATLNTNTLDASNIHYIITENNSKEILEEGTLTNSLNAESTFTSGEKTEINAGLNGTYGNIYKIYTSFIPYNSVSYDLYLFVDENATEYQNSTFKAGVAVKASSLETDFKIEYFNLGTNLAMSSLLNQNVTCDISNISELAVGTHNINCTSSSGEKIVSHIMIDDLEKIKETADNFEQYYGEKPRMCYYGTNVKKNMFEQLDNIMIINECVFYYGANTSFAMDNPDNNVYLSYLSYYDNILIKTFKNELTKLGRDDIYTINNYILFEKKLTFEQLFGQMILCEKYLNGEETTDEAKNACLNLSSLRNYDMGL